MRNDTKLKTYKFLEKVFHLPSSEYLSQYGNPAAHDPDGVLYTVLNMSKEAVETYLEEKKKTLSSKDYDDIYCWFGSLAFDSKDIKEKVILDPHTGEIVGFAQDAFELDIIFEELKNLYGKDEWWIYWNSVWPLAIGIRDFSTVVTVN